MSARSDHIWSPIICYSLHLWCRIKLDKLRFFQESCSPASGVFSTTMATRTNSALFRMTIVCLTQVSTLLCFLSFNVRWSLRIDCGSPFAVAHEFSSHSAHFRDRISPMWHSKVPNCTDIWHPQVRVRGRCSTLLLWRRFTVHSYLIMASLWDLKANI